MRALAARLEEGLARGGSAGALEELWQGVELELVRQACVHCAERGELMEAVRRRREAQAGVMRRQVAAQRLELQQLRRDVEMLDMVGAALSARGAEAVSQEQRRVRLLSEVCVPLSLALLHPQPQPQPTPRPHLHPRPLSPPPGAGSL